MFIIDNKVRCASKARSIGTSRHRFRVDHVQRARNARARRKLVSRDWEATLSSWSQPPGQTEQDRCDRAANMVKKAIEASPRLNYRDYEVCAHGSYRNRTNVPGESDVDVAVCLKDTFFYTFDFAPGISEATAKISPATYTFEEFKSDVGAALVAHFGAPNVYRGNKAFDVRENTYRVDADVLACFQHRRYVPSEERSIYARAMDGPSFESGVEFITDRERAHVINWPHQNYANGVEKNDATGRRYKAAVRIMKNLKNEMGEKSDTIGVCGFVVESLLWSVSNGCFGQDSYYKDIREVIRFAFQATASDEACRSWSETNGRKYLFHPTQAWTRQQVNDFLLAAWRYVAFE